MAAPVRIESRCGACLLYAAIEGTTDGMILVDPGGRVFHINRRGHELLGLGPLGATGVRIGHLLGSSPLADLWAAAASEHAPVTGEIALPSGPTVQATVSTCLAADGTPIGRMVVLRDTTREKRFQIELASSVVDRLMKLTAEDPPTSRPLPLTSREQEIVQLLVEGLTNAQMAERLHVSLNTVASHLKHIYSKLNVTSRAQAMALAVSLGIRPRGKDHKIR